MFDASVAAGPCHFFRNIMINTEDYQKLIDFARYHGFSINITFWEADNTYSVEVMSAAKNENYSEKRVIDANHFIRNWENKCLKKN